MSAPHCHGGPGCGSPAPCPCCSYPSCPCVMRAHEGEHWTRVCVECAEGVVADTVTRECARCIEALDELVAVMMMGHAMGPCCPACLPSAVEDATAVHEIGGVACPGWTYTRHELDPVPCAVLACAHVGPVTLLIREGSPERDPILRHFRAEIERGPRPPITPPHVCKRPNCPSAGQPVTVRPEHALGGAHFCGGCGSRIWPERRPYADTPTAELELWLGFLQIAQQRRPDAERDIQDELRRRT